MNLPLGIVLCRNTGLIIQRSVSRRPARCSATGWPPRADGYVDAFRTALLVTIGFIAIALVAATTDAVTGRRERRPR
jgi:hypothetical protein